MAFTFKHGDRPLDDYTIQRGVGRGGFGEVYYAVSDGGREVALKYLRDNPQVELRGVSHCINLKSPHLVSVFDVKQNAEGDYFIVMEYVSGPSLRDIILAEPNGIGPQKAAFFVKELAKGLAYLHDRGIVHRDLKPGNVFYDEGYVKIGDYGLSKFISISRHSAQTASVGTVHYMAPEVGSGNYHRGIDIYALGVILYEMLLGTVPFEGGSMGEVLMKHLTAQPEVDDLPEPFGKVIRKALAKDPKDRYQTVYEMVDDLMGVEDIKSSLAGFDHASLGAAVAVRRDAGHDSPVPSPNPTPRQGFGEARKRPTYDMDAGVLPPKLAAHLGNIGNKVSQRLEALEGRIGPHRQPRRPGRRVHGRKPERALKQEPPRTVRGYIARSVLLSCMSVGLGLAVGLLVEQTTNWHREEPYACAITTILLLPWGLALGCRGLAYFGRNHQPEWVERLSFAAGVTIPALLGTVPMGRDELVFPVFLTMIAAALFVDWRARIRCGSRGELSVGKAFWAGLFSLIVCAILSQGDDKLLLLSGGVVASVSLVTQAMAWLFPLGEWLDGTRRSVPQEDHTSDFLRHGGHGANISEDGEMPADPASPAVEKERADDVVHKVAGVTQEEIAAASVMPHRWGLTRFVGALLGFAFFVGAVVFLAAAVTGEPFQKISHATITNGEYHSVRHTYSGCSVEVQILRSAIAGACFGLCLLGLRHTGRVRIGGFYRNTLWPILMSLVLAGMGASIAALLISTPSVGIRGVLLLPVANKITLVVSLFFFIVLLCKRGHHKRLPRGDRFFNQD